MPRDSSGNYTLPAGNPVVPGTTIETSWANTTLNDVATALTNSLDRSGNGGLTGPLLLDAGSVSAPAISYTLEPATGFYRPGAGSVGLSIQGALRYSFAPGVFAQISNDAGAAAGPEINLLRDSASPAASDAIGRVNLAGINSAAEQVIYANISATITDPTDGSEDGTITLSAMQGGTLTPAVTIGTNSRADFTGNVFANGGIYGRNGSAIAPAFSFTTDTNTGLYRPAADTVAVTSGGVNSAVFGPSTVDLSGDLSVGGDALLTSDDAGATAGPTINLYRDSASPANNDELGSIKFTGRDDAGDEVTYGTLQTSIVSNFAAGHSGKFSIFLPDFATLQEHFYIQPVVGGIFRDNVESYGARMGLTNFNDVGQENLFTVQYNNFSGSIVDNDPFFSLQVSGIDSDTSISNAAAIQFLADSTWTTESAASTRMEFKTTAVGETTQSTKMTIRGSGNVGIGGDAPNNRLVVTSSASNIARLINSASALGLLQFQGNVTTVTPQVGADVNDLIFRTNNSEAARIDSVGAMMWRVTTTGAVTSADAKAILGSTAIMTSGRTLSTTANHHVFYNPNGQVGSINTAASATNYLTSSDERLKDNIVDAPSASDDIDAIRIRSFDWKADGAHQTYGVIAQELDPIAPMAVSKGEEAGDMWGVDYSKLVPLLVKEVQELRARVAQLENV